MDFEDTAYDLLERALIDENANPTDLPLSLLKSITNNFSDDLQIGRGGFAVVYKGLLKNGVVAVKKLTQTFDIHEKKFHQEVDSLMRVNHQNIVRFLGYCSDTQGKVWKLNGKNVMAEDRQRFLCFEYLPQGSLDKYISGASKGLGWMTRYQIIKGICKGLHYLHQQNIVHLDLKPANILLNRYMLPKITDFGLSRCFDEKQTRAVTSNLFGSQGYMAPEFYGGLITLKSDIYSLGIIIIEILTGNKGYPDIDNVLESWSIKFEMSPGDKQLKPVRVCAEIGIQCTDFNPANRPSIGCILERLNEMESTYGVTESDFSDSLKQISLSDFVDEASSTDIAQVPSQPHEIRSVPDHPMEANHSVSAAPLPLQRITGVLQGPGGTSRKILSDQSSEISKLLEIYPLELQFPWEPYLDVECSVTVTNRTQHHIGVWITSTCMDRNSDICFTFKDNKEDSEEDSQEEFEDEHIKESASFFHSIMEPHSTFAIALTMEAQQEPPPDTMFEVLMVVIGTKRRLQNMVSSVGIKLNVDNEFLKRVENFGGEVHGAMLKAVICDPASFQTVIHNRQFIRTPLLCKKILSIDLHPIETWILVRHWYGGVSILNYVEQKIEMELEEIRNKKGSIATPSTWKHIFPSTTTCYSEPYNIISSAKFIAQEEWFAAGDIYGWVHVYSYTTKEKVIEFEAHQHHREAEKGEVVLAVHHASPHLLTSSLQDDWIKLWDWSQGWECIRKFDNNFSGTPYVTWNPMDSEAFFGVSSRGVKVWNINSSNPITRSDGSCKASGFCLYRGGYQDFLVTSESSSGGRAHVWNLQTMERVHEFSLKGETIYEIACHPTLSILVTRFKSTIGVWDARTYRLLTIVDIGVTIEGMVLIDTEGSLRLIVTCGKWISSIEINLKSLDMIELQTDGLN